MPALLDRPKVATHAANVKVHAYIAGVLSGEIVACKYVRQAVERHVRDLATADARGLWFDEEEAQLTLDFIELCSHSKGKWAGQRIVLEPWQAFVFWMLFGWKKLDGTRRFNTAFISVARKNGKSTLCAAISLKLLVADGEPGAEVYNAATKRDQAKIVFNESRRMVRKSPALKHVVTVLRDVLSVEATESTCKPLGKDADTLDGLNPSGVIIDELHAHKTREVWDVMETGTGSRDNPLQIGITTAGDANDQECIYFELKEYTIRVLSGQDEFADDSWFGIIYTLDEGDDWQNPETWIKANPNLGVSVYLNDLTRKARKASRIPDAVANFKRKHCNLETASVTSWLDTVDGSAWAACNGGDFYGPSGLTPEAIERFRGRPCWIGGDLSSIGDLTALACAFMDDDGILDLIVQAWCPRDNAIGRQRDKSVPYVTWGNGGLIHLTEGNSVDYEEIRAFLRNARDVWEWDIQLAAFDPCNATHLMNELTTQDGWSDCQIVRHLQTCNVMNDPICLTEKAILDGKLRHGGHKVLRWCVSNALVYKDTGGRKRFDKKNGKEKIDLAVASVMACGLAITRSGMNQEPKLLLC